VPIPGVELGFAQLLDGLGRAVWERVKQLGAQRIDLLIETAEINLAALEQVLAGSKRLTGLRLAKHETSELVDKAACFHDRMGNDLAVDLERRNHVGDHAHKIRFRRGKRLTQHTCRHSTLGANHDWEKARGAADRCRAVLWSSLAEPCKILGNGKVAGHADF